MTDLDLAAAIDAAWEDRETLGPSTRSASREAVEEALEGLDAGRLRVAEKSSAGWQVHQWLKKAVLLSFRLNDMVEIPGGPTDPERGAARWWTRCRQNSRAGRRTAFAMLVFVQCQARSSAARPTSRQMSC
jgi:2,3,4,5-tetrahydropyridine-2,6-dicarboxylate N-succinyltransferase